MNNGEIIDLSYPLSSDMIVFPGAERPTFSWLGRENSEGYNLTRFTMIAHTGTHTDSPLHFVAGGETIDRISLDCFYGKTRLFRSAGEPRGQKIGLNEIGAASDDIEEGSIFVLETGIGKRAETAEYNRCYPLPSEELVTLLLKKRIRAYMTDATSVDKWDSVESPNHKAILGAGIPIVENLANLDQLPEGKPFLISALPLRLAGREGSPCRAVAVL